MQDRALYWACYNDDVVRAQELLALNANVNYHYSDHGQVSDSAHTLPKLVIACVACTLCTDTTSVR